MYKLTTTDVQADITIIKYLLFYHIRLEIFKLINLQGDTFIKNIIIYNYILIIYLWNPLC